MKSIEAWKQIYTIFKWSKQPAFIQQRDIKPSLLILNSKEPVKTLCKRLDTPFQQRVYKCGVHMYGIRRYRQIQW